MAQNGGIREVTVMDWDIIGNREIKNGRTVEGLEIKTRSLCWIQDL